ncbi:hypothetical protein LC612_38870 [Nostoc sp. CHAB 5834]|nr:hypothetical protein [Nostoc sp. CHAB 5834]
MPDKPGWYRVRTPPSSNAWWLNMAYFNGNEWVRKGVAFFGKTPGQPELTTIEVTEWQGLVMPANLAVETARRLAEEATQASVRKRCLEIASRLSLPEENL